MRMRIYSNTDDTDVIFIVINKEYDYEDEE